MIDELTFVLTSFISIVFRQFLPTDAFYIVNCRLHLTSWFLLQFTKAGHIFVCVHLNEDVNMVMDGGVADPDDTLDGEVESAGPLVDMSHQFNTLSGRETADYRNSWEMFERLLTQERLAGDHDKWNYSESDDVVNLVVSVEDTGVGIPLHVQDRVFTPFMQVRKRSKSRF